MKRFAVISLLCLTIFCLAKADPIIRDPQTAEQEMGFYNAVQSWSADTLMARGHRYLWAAEPTKGLICFTTQTVRYSESMSRTDKKLCADAYVGKWFAYFFWYFDFARALENLREAQTIIEEIDGNPARIYLNYGCTEQMIGEITADTAMLQKAVVDYRRAFDLSTGDADHVTTRQMAFSNLVTVIHELGQPISSLDSIVAAFESDELVSKSPTYQVDVLYHRGYQLIDQGNYDAAIETFTQMLNTARQSFSLMRYELIALIGRAEAHARQADHPLGAITDLNLALALSDSLGMRDTRLELLRKYAEVYESIGDRDHAMKYHNDYVLLKDSILNYQQGVRISDINSRSTILDMEKNARELQTSNRIQRTITIAAVLVAVILLFFIIMLWLKHRRLQQANRALYDKALKDTATAAPASSDADSDAVALYNQISQVVEQGEDVYSPDFTVARLAEIMKMQPAQISKAINSVSGDNFSAFINELRIKRACRLVTANDATANLTLEAIAEMVGFKSRTSFIQAFKKFTGLTPSEFKRINREQTA